MSRIELTGLRGDLPIGAMAAFGVLRICSRNERFTGAKLCWSGDGGDYRAALVTENDVSAEELMEALLEEAGRAREWPDWEQVKTLTRDEFRAEAHNAAGAASPDNRERADWIACLANELAFGHGKLESTPFDMSVARQKFFGGRAPGCRIARLGRRVQRGAVRAVEIPGRSTFSRVGPDHDQAGGIHAQGSHGHGELRCPGCGVVGV